MNSASSVDSHGDRGESPGSNGRLVDDQGAEWSRPKWLTEKQVKQWIGRDQRVVVYGYDRGMSWLTAAEAREFWPTIRRRFEVPGGSAPPRDTTGPSYAAVLWRCGDRRLLGFRESC